MKNEKRSSSSLGMIAAFILAKGTKLFAVLKTLKYAKYLITLVSMAFSAVAYGFYCGSWAFAIGFVLLILIHESGHVMAMIQKGVKGSAPVFIPFLGAAVFMKEIKDRNKEAYIGFGGPFIGSLAAIICIGIAFLFSDNQKVSTIFHLLGYVGLMLNLFNMIPARPLDGGRILHVLGYKVAYLGVSVLLVLAFLSQDIFLVLIAIMSALEALLIRKYIAFFLAACCFASWFFHSIIDPVSNSYLHVVLLIFSVLSTIFFFVLSISSKIRPKEDEDEEAAILERKNDASSNVSFTVKFVWVAVYLTTISVLSCIMVWHSQYLPKEVHNHPITQYFSED